MILLTVDEIIEIHKKIISTTGGSYELRDRGLLESAVYSTEASFDDIYRYQTVQQKAARIAYALITNHAFVDGNKRIGVLTMLMLLRLNDIEISYKQSELTSLGLSVASGELQYEDILNWIEKHEK